jgi:hypothetical protein
MARRINRASANESGGVPMNWRSTFVFRVACRRGRIARAFATAVILLGAPPAWTQNEGAGAPEPDNVLQLPSLNGTFSRWIRPPVAEAAPRNSQNQRARAAKAKMPAEALAPEPAPQPVAPAWPNAEASAGTGTILPVVLKTVREMAEPEPEISLVYENELSDIDIAAKPLAAQPLPGQPEAVDVTDGRAIGDDPDFLGDRFAAFAENVKAIGNASWLEALVLALAGAIAAVTAMRVFARP